MDEKLKKENLSHLPRRFPKAYKMLKDEIKSRQGLGRVRRVDENGNALYIESDVGNVKSVDDQIDGLVDDLISDHLGSGFLPSISEKVDKLTETVLKKGQVSELDKDEFLNELEKLEALNLPEDIKKTIQAIREKFSDDPVKQEEHSPSKTSYGGYKQLSFQYSVDGFFNRAGVPLETCDGKRVVKKDNKTAPERGFKRGYIAESDEVKLFVNNASYSDYLNNNVNNEELASLSKIKKENSLKYLLERTGPFSRSPDKVESDGYTLTKTYNVKNTEVPEEFFRPGHPYRQKPAVQVSDGYDMLHQLFHLRKEGSNDGGFVTLNAGIGATVADGYKGEQEFTVHAAQLEKQYASSLAELMAVKRKVHHHKKLLEDYYSKIGLDMKDLL